MVMTPPALLAVPTPETPLALAPVAVGDIHGRLDLLDALIARFPGRRFVFLGDYVDRGPDSPGVVARVRELVEAGRAVALLGNHDEMLIEALLDPRLVHIWEINGGTPDQWSSRDALLADALWMEQHLKPWHTEGRVLFAHAMRPHPSDTHAHLWGRPNDTPLYPLPEGVTTSVHGHTPLEACPLPVGVEDGTIAWFVDTGAVWTGRLTALDCDSMRATVVTL